MSTITKFHFLTERAQTCPKTQLVFYRNFDLLKIDVRLIRLRVQVTYTLLRSVVIHTGCYMMKR